MAGIFANPAAISLVPNSHFGNDLILGGTAMTIFRQQPPLCGTPTPPFSPCPAPTTERKVTSQSPLIYKTPISHRAKSRIIYQGIAVTSVCYILHQVRAFFVLSPVMGERRDVHANVTQADINSHKIEHTKSSPTVNRRLERSSSSRSVLSKKDHNSKKKTDALLLISRAAAWRAQGQRVLLLPLPLAKQMILRALSTGIKETQRSNNNSNRAPKRKLPRKEKWFPAP
jgi:hypothetical protein